MPERAVAPVVGVTTLVAITVVLAALVGGMLFGVELEDPPKASVEVTVENNTIDLTHRSGDPLDVSEIALHVSINGQRLDYQPPIPFFAADGFKGGPTGPFNSRTEGKTWSAGETAGFTIARTTNTPQPASGDRLVVRIVLDDHVVAVAETTID